MDPLREQPSQPRRSCLTCAAAKVKCLQSDQNASGPSEKCDRCLRLNKSCVLQAATVRKARTKKKTTRVAQLEEKLDGLVHLLTSKEHPPTYPSPESVVRLAQSPINVGTSRSVEDTTSSVRLDPHGSLGIGASFASLTFEESHDYLETFRTDLTPQFPFVIVPATLTIERLRQERPALFAAIVVAASYKNFSRHVAYGEDLLRSITERVVINGEKTLELLQALLVYTVWYRSLNHFKNRVTQLVSLMAALVAELNLSRASAVNERLTVTIEDTRGSYGCATRNRGVRTLEERRAYLGVFCVSSCVSTNFRELNAVKRSAYQEDCCIAIERAAEYPTDAVLVCLARLQIAIERIGHTFQYGTSNPSPRQTFRIPLPLYTMPLERDLDEFRKDLPPELRDNNLMMLHFHSAGSYLFEIALYEPIQDSYFGQPSFRRMEYLYGCLQSIRSFHDVFFAIPADQFFHASLLTWIQITHSTITLSKLCFLDAEDWNVAHAREAADFSRLLERLALKFDETRNLQEVGQGPEDNETDILHRLASRMRLIKDKYDQKVAAEASSSEQPAPTTFPIGPNQLMDTTAMDYISTLEGDAFWQEIMGGTWPMDLNLAEN